MELVKLEDDLKIIQNLSTFPNADDGLTPEELKEKFDLAGQKIQQYLNEQVVPAVRDLQGSKSPFCVTVNSDQNGGFAMDKTMDELHKAYNAGQLMYCNHGTLLPLATVFSDSTNSQGYMFQGMQYGTTFVRVRIDSNGIVVETSALAKTGDALRNPQKLILTGAVAAEYDGSAEVTVEIPAVDFRVDVFSSSDGYVADETIDDIQAVDKAGRTVYCALETDEQQWIYLPMVKVQDSVYYFAAVCEGVEWLVTIARGDEDNTVVNVTQHEAGGSGGSAEIHVGSDEPTGDEEVWIDPNAVPDEIPSGGGTAEWELINEITLEEAVTSILIDRDKNGNAFDLDEISVIITYSDATEGAGTWYYYVNTDTSAINTAGAIATSGKGTVVFDYRKGSGYMRRIEYKYGHEFGSERIQVDSLDENGNFKPQQITCFRMKNFTSAKLPIGTHIMVTGRRAK